MKIEVGYWETRDGRKARVLCTDAPGEWPVVGYIICGNNAEPWVWFADGRGQKFGGELDLIRPWIDRPTIDWSKEREWVKAVAMDRCGSWCRFDGIPTCAKENWLIDDPFRYIWMHPSEYPQFAGDWKDSLCVRPEVKV